MGQHYLRVIVVFAVLIVAAIAFDRLAPPQHNPRAPLDLTDPVGLATAGKLDDLEDRPEACFQALTSAAVGYQRIEDTPSREPCGFTDALYLKQSVTPYSSIVRTSCPLAAALYVWERHVLQVAARTHLGTPVGEIETYGTFSCRRIGGGRSGRWSEHARANAIDIRGFRLGDGRAVSVQHDWRADTPEGRFLEAVFEGGCDIFRVALGPDYNAAHADHFHFDMGPGLTCR